MARIALKNGINAILDDYCKRISRQTIRVYGDANWPSIRAMLGEWESKGYLRILRDPETANDADICVEMLNYIEQKSPWPNWP